MKEVSCDKDYDGFVCNMFSVGVRAGLTWTRKFTLDLTEFCDKILAQYSCPIILRHQKFIFSRKNMINFIPRQSCECCRVLVSRCRICRLALHMYVEQKCSFKHRSKNLTYYTLLETAPNLWYHAP